MVRATPATHMIKEMYKDCWINPTTVPRANEPTMMNWPSRSANSCP